MFAVHGSQREKVEFQELWNLYITSQQIGGGNESHNKDSSVSHHKETVPYWHGLHCAKKSVSWRERHQSV
jgi:hypothetical protein